MSTVRLETAPEFSPDGRQIAYFSEGSGRRELWVSDADGTNARPLTDFQASSGHPPSWSPDGEDLVFASNFGPANSAGGVFVISTITREVRRIGDGSFVAPTWSRDGHWIYLTAKPQGSEYEIWKIPASGGTPAQITKHGGFFALESSDGKFLFYTKGPGGIWKMPKNGGEEAEVLPELAPFLRGFWRVFPDGIYFLDAGADGGQAIEFFEFTTRRKHRIGRLTGNPTMFHGALTVSPDRKWIVYSQISRSANDIMLVENFR